VSKLTSKNRREYYSPIMERQEGKCLYCKTPFTDKRVIEYDHLLDNPNQSEIEDVCLAHKTCNNKKKFNSDYQIIAHDAAQEYRRAVFTCGNTLADTGTTKELTSQQQINKINYPIAKQFIQEHTLTEKEVILRDAVNAIVDICKDNNGTGSQSAVYRYIDSLTNPYTGKYTLSTNSQGKTIIRRRTEN